MPAHHNAPPNAPASVPPAARTTHASTARPDTPSPSGSTRPATAVVRSPRATATSPPQSPDSPPPPPEDSGNSQQCARPSSAPTATPRTQTPVPPPLPF